MHRLTHLFLRVRSLPRGCFRNTDREVREEKASRRDRCQRSERLRHHASDPLQARVPRIHFLTDLAEKEQTGDENLGPRKWLFHGAGGGADGGGAKIAGLETERGFAVTRARKRCASGSWCPHCCCLLRVAREGSVWLGSVQMGLFFLGGGG